MINLIKEPILENENLKTVPKVLVLQHCRGEEQIDIDSDSSSDSECETDGAAYERSHRMVSIFICGFGWKLSQPFLRMTQLFFGRHQRGIQPYELKMGQFISNISSSALMD